MSASPQPVSEASEDRDPHGWRQEGRDLLRGVAAGSIVGMPLLYTMEMWWHGMLVSESHLLILIAVTFLLNAAFSLFSGFRETYSLGEAASEAISSLGLSLLLAVALLGLIGEVDFQAAWIDILGKAVLVAVPISVGMSFANTQVRGKSRSGEEGDASHGNASHDTPSDADPETLQLKEDLIDVAATFSGATIFALSIAPTEEVVLISARLSAWQHLLLMAVAMGLCYLILFAAGFQEHRVYVPSLFQHGLVETIMAYAIALLVSFLLLYLIGPSEAMSQPVVALMTTVTLGLPTVIGGAAGRLIT